MSVEVGWSKNPNAKVNWHGGLVSGIIVPDRVARMRLVAASAPPGLEPSRRRRRSASPINPAGHRGYAATWFALAVIALIIYALAVRKRSRGRQAVSGERHVLPNGLTVAVDPLPGAESVCARASTQVSVRAPSRRGLSGLAHLVEHMVFKGAGGRDTRALAEVDRGCRRHRSTPGLRATRRCFTAAALARDLPLVAELIADLVRAPAFR